MTAHVRPASIEDCYDLAPRLREADIAEIRASSGQSPLDALFEGVRRSTQSYSVEDQNGKLFAMFGVARHPYNDKVGIVWMLASDDIKKHARQLLREAKRWWSVLHNHYPVLWNLVDARNHVHIRWLKWAGAKFTGEKIHGRERRPFLEFIHEQCVT
jgi:hypothetical protein